MTATRSVDTSARRYLAAIDRWIEYETALGVPLGGARLEAMRLLAEMEERRSGTAVEQVLADEWKAELIQRNIIDSTGKNTRQAFRRLASWLVEQEAVGAEQVIVDGKERTRVWFRGSTITFLPRAEHPAPGAPAATGGTP
jgi:hypothetical protein